MVYGGREREEGVAATPTRRGEQVQQQSGKCNSSETGLLGHEAPGGGFVGYSGMERCGVEQCQERERERAGVRGRDAAWEDDEYRRVRKLWEDGRHGVGAEGWRLG